MADLKRPWPGSFTVSRSDRRGEAQKRLPGRGNLDLNPDSPTRFGSWFCDPVSGPAQQRA